MLEALANPVLHRIKPVSELGLASRCQDSSCQLGFHPPTSFEIRSMIGEILRLEIGIRRSHSNSSPADTPLQPGDEQPCSAARTFSCPRLGWWVREKQESVQNRMKERSREGSLGRLTTASIVGMSL